MKIGKFEIDLKTILIIILLITTTIFGYKWFFQTEDLIKYKVKEYEEENKRLQKDIDSLTINIEKYNKEYTEFIKSKDSLDKLIKESEIEIEKAKSNAEKSLQELNKLREEFLEIQNKIKKLEKSPIKREGDDLINSIKNNL